MAQSFIAVAATMVVTPGAGFVLFVNTAVTRGRRAAMALVSGILSGTATIALAVVLGFSAVRAFVPGIALPLRVAGGCYLIYLGIRSLRATPRAVEVTDHVTDTGSHRAVSGEPLVEPWGPLMSEGVISALTNPGLLVMYLSLLPSYIPERAPWTRTAFPLAAAHVAMVITWYAFLLTVLTIFGSRFATQKRQRTVAMLGGGALIFFGVRTLAQF